MIQDVIKDCPITLSTASIVMPFIDDVKSKEYKKYGGYHTGIDIKAEEVYANCHCVVIYVGYNTEDKNVVVIQYDVNTAFRFANLLSVNVEEGTPIETGTLIGIADEFVHFEYWNRQESEWIARASKETYYKHDPIEYVKGNVEFNNTVQNLEFQDIDPSIDQKVNLGELVLLKEGEFKVQFTTTSFQGQKTQFERKYGKAIVPNLVPYICLPTNFKYAGKSAQDLIGYTCAIVDEKNKSHCYALIGDYCSSRNSISVFSGACREALGYSTSIRSITSTFKIYADFNTMPNWSEV